MILNKTLISPTTWVDRFFDQFERAGYAQRISPRPWTSSRRDAYVLRAELPGVAKENLNVEVKENRLILSGHKEAVTRGEEGKYRYVESRWASSPEYSNYRATSRQMPLKPISRTGFSISVS